MIWLPLAKNGTIKTPKVISAIEHIYKTHEFIITLKKLKFHTLDTTVNNQVPTP